MLCLLLTALLALSPLQAAEATNVEDSLVLAIQSTKTLELLPLEPLERDIMSIFDIVYEGLVVIDDDYMPQPCLAESWTETGNGKTWTFHLRKGVKFSNGLEMTAHDVVATAKAILEMAKRTDGASKGYYYNLNYFIDTITASGDYTVVVKAKRSYWGILYAMTFPVLPKGYIQNSNPPGTGAYCVEEFVPGNYIRLTGNPYWQNNLQVQDIMVIIKATQREVIEEYEYARVDTIFTRAISAAQYKSGLNSLALDYRTNQLETLLINHYVDELSSVNVRKAIRHAIDVDKIASTIYMGLVERTDTPMIAGTWMYNENLDNHFRTDLDEARRLLEEDGWADTNDDGFVDKPTGDGESENLHLRIFVYEEPDDNVRVETANIIADSLAQIGISTSISTIDFNTMKSRLDAGNFDLALASFAMDVCPDPGFLLMKGNTGNFGRYQSTEMTNLCNELRKQDNFTDYQRKLHEIQALFAEECPFICMFYRSGTVLTRRMYTTARDVRELELLRGIESFQP